MTTPQDRNADARRLAGLPDDWMHRPTYWASLITTPAARYIAGELERIHQLLISGVLASSASARDIAARVDGLRTRVASAGLDRDLGTLIRDAIVAGDAPRSIEDIERELREALDPAPDFRVEVSADGKTAGMHIRADKIIVNDPTKPPPPIDYTGRDLLRTILRTAAAELGDTCDLGEALRRGAAEAVDRVVRNVQEDRDASLRAHIARVEAIMAESGLPEIIRNAIRTFSSPTMGQGSVHGGQVGHIVYEGDGIPFVVQAICEAVGVAHPQADVDGLLATMQSGGALGALTRDVFAASQEARAAIDLRAHAVLAWAHDRIIRTRLELQGKTPTEPMRMRPRFSPSSIAPVFDGGVTITREYTADPLRELARIIGDDHPRWQTKALHWAVAAFGDVAYSRRERALRFFEEAAELATCFLLPAERSVLCAIVAHVVAQPRGEALAEFGQAGFTLEILGEAIGTDLRQETQREWGRLQLLPVEALRERHALKVKLGISEA